MKSKTFLFLILLLTGCSDEETTSNNGIKQYTGIWSPYEIVYEDGSVDKGPFTASSIFGVYAESVQLNENNKYVPLMWTDKDHYDFKEEEGGNFDYQSTDMKLLFTDGVWEMEFEIIKFNDDELWLKSVVTDGSIPTPQAQHKLKRVSK